MESVCNSGSLASPTDASRSPEFLPGRDSGKLGLGSGCLLANPGLAQAEHAQAGADHVKRDRTPELAQASESFGVGEDRSQDVHNSYHPNGKQQNS